MSNDHDLKKSLEFRQNVGTPCHIIKIRQIERVALFSFSLISTL